jgi:cytidyltransferase-like protein
VTRTAVYPGSFDPITNGHIDLVRRSLQVFDRVVVAVAFNPNKDQAWFTPEERAAMIRETFAAEGDRVEVDKFSSLLVDYAAKKGANVIVRGLRAVADFEYEFQMTYESAPRAPARRFHDDESHSTRFATREGGGEPGNVAGHARSGAARLLAAAASPLSRGFAGR